MSFPVSEAAPIRFTGPLPDRCDVVVIGGGIAGIMSAWHLAERGLRVALCEKAALSMSIYRLIGKEPT